MVVVTQWLFVGGGGWWWWLRVKLRLVVGKGGKIMVGRGKIMPGCGWLWVVVTKLRLVVVGRAWPWLVARFSNAL